MFFRSIGLTSAGAAYLALVLLVSIAAARSGDNDLYAILAIMLSAIIISGIVSRNTLKQLALTLQTPDRIFAGSAVITRVSLTNTKRLFPSLAIFVEEMEPLVKASSENLVFCWVRGHLARIFQEDAGEPPAFPGVFGACFKNASKKKTRYNERHRNRPRVFFSILRAGETRSGRLEQTFLRRGLQRQTLQSATRCPFGFFQRFNSLPSQEILVYPALGKIPDFLQTDTLTVGRRENRLRGAGENFYSIREYRDGESARSIDWKASAKARKLMAREYSCDDTLRCFLMLDTYSVLEKHDPESIEKKENTDGRAEELFEKAVSLSAGLAARFINDGASLEFFTPEVHIQADSGDRQLYRILEALALTHIFNVDSTETARSCMYSTAELQKLISGHAFSVILTPRPEESFPVGIRRFSKIVSFSHLDGFR